MVSLSFLTTLTACGGGGGPSDTAVDTNTGNDDLGGTVVTNDPDKRADSIIDQMTLSQKVSLVHGYGAPNAATSYSYIGYPVVQDAFAESVGFIRGIPQLGIPDNNMIDASNGLNVPNKNATSLPSTVGLAASWNKDLAYKYGRRIGAETRALGFATALGGGINLIREPRNGRGFEFMGEDPILTGELAAERTLGTQSEHVIGTIKHFAFNDYDTNRYVANMIVDEQTMHETELLAFEIAIKKGKPGYVMCSFNQVNGTYACGNKHLIQDILKDDWGFKGIVLSDWGATPSTVDAANAGMDEEQPGQMTDDTEVPQMMKMLMGGPFYINALKTAVNDNEVPMSRLNDMVHRKLRTMISVGLLDNPPQRTSIDEAAGEKDAKLIADQSIVMLKNAVPNNGEDDAPILPLAKNTTQSIAVIGMYADSGVLSGGGSGGNSALIENQVQGCGQLPISPYPSCPNFIGVAPLNAIKAEFPNATVTYLDGKDVNAAVAAAKQADVTILFGGQWQSEGSEKQTLNLDSPTTDSSGIMDYDQDALFASVAQQAKRTVVVLETGGPVVMPWLADVDSVLEAWYPGVRGGSAIADILSGDVNPSAKLPMAFPASVADVPQPDLPTDLGAATGMGWMPRSLEGMVKRSMGEEQYEAMRAITYTEKLAWNGYKWMDENNITPLFPFGFGLSYSTFDYSGIYASADAQDNVTVTFNITNTSNVDGAEVAQVYVSLPDNVPGNKQPPKKLVGWSRVELSAGETKAVTVNVPKKYISTWDARNTHSWILTPGTYTFIVNDSAANESPNKLSTIVQID